MSSKLGEFLNERARPGKTTQPPRTKTKGAVDLVVVDQAIAGLNCDITIADESCLVEAEAVVDQVRDVNDKAAHVSTAPKPAHQPSTGIENIMANELENTSKPCLEILSCENGLCVALRDANSDILQVRIIDPRTKEYRDFGSIDEAIKEGVGIRRTPIDDILSEGGTYPDILRDGYADAEIEAEGFVIEGEGEARHIVATFDTTGPIDVSGVKFVFMNLSGACNNDTYVTLRAEDGEVLQVKFGDNQIMRFGGETGEVPSHGFPARSAIRAYD